MTEVVWEGKYRDGKRVAPVRIALPFQTIETVNESTRDRARTLDLFASGQPTEWRNRLIWGDKKYVLPSLLPEFAGKVNLIYIDPPFDTGADFKFTAKIPESEEKFDKPPSMIEMKAYRDTWGVSPDERRRGVGSLDKYLKWFYETTLVLRELLADDGSLYVHLDENVGHYAKGVLDEVFGLDSFQREIVWRIGWISGYKSKAKNWIRNHDTLLFYVKDKQRFTFNTETIPYPPGYVRRDGKPPTGKGHPVEDVWNGSHLDPMDSIQIMSLSGEKVGYPTQKNETSSRESSELPRTRTTSFSIASSGREPPPQLPRSSVVAGSRATSVASRSTRRASGSWASTASSRSSYRTSASTSVKPGWPPSSTSPRTVLRRRPRTVSLSWISIAPSRSRVTRGSTA